MAAWRRARWSVPAGWTGRGGVAEIQRARIIAALVEVAGERGVGRVTVAHIVARSGVSVGRSMSCSKIARIASWRRSIWRWSAARGGWSRRLGRGSLARVRSGWERVGKGAAAGGPAWRERIRAGLAALLEYLDEEPGMGALCVVDALGGGPGVGASRAWSSGCWSTRCTRAEGGAGGFGADAVDGRGRRRRGARGSARAASPSRPEADGEPAGPVDGDDRAALSGARGGGEGGGAAGARRAGARSARRATRLRELDMRLTYRTVRVLLAIALGAANASNREVSEAAGVQDRARSPSCWRAWSTSV